MILRCYLSLVSFFVVVLTSFILIGSTTAWAKSTLDVNMTTQGDYLQFDLSIADGALKQNQVKINLNEKKKDRPVLLLEVADVKASTRWLIKFKESKHPDIKGILLRKKEGAAQLRIRYLKAIKGDFRKRIRIRQVGTHLNIEIPMSPQIMKKAPATQVNPSRTSDAKIKRVREITSSLKDDSTPVKKESTSPGVPSPLEQSTHATPLPPTAQMRRVEETSTAATVQPVVPPPVVNRPSFVPKKSTNTIIPVDQKAPTPFPKAEMKPQQKPQVKLTGSSKSVTQTKTNSLGGMTEEPFAEWQYWTVAGLFFFVAFIFLFKGKKQNHLNQLNPQSNQSVLAFAEQHLKQQSKNVDYGENQVHILSERIVNQDPLQKVLVVEINQQTLVIGSADNAGLSFLTNLTVPPRQASAPAPSTREAYSNQYESYDDHYIQNSKSVQALHDVGNEYYDDVGMQDYAENTYVNESGAYTDEISALHAENSGSDMMQDRYPTQNITQRAQEAFKPEINHYAESHNDLNDLNSLVDEVQDSAYQSDVDASDPVEDVSADDLLQKIRQLNRG